MARTLTSFACQACGATHTKWTGRCDTCGEWNSLLEESNSENTPNSLDKKKGHVINFVGLKGSEKEPSRKLSYIKEFDRVTGGGLVPGSAILVGGDPGIGKSTLLMQVAASLSKDFTCVYISGEEAVDQLRLRASRLKLTEMPLGLAAATSVRDIKTTLDNKDNPNIVIIDSIQCMYMDNLDSSPGTVSQVRNCAQELIRLAKRKGFTVILVGHVTKDGTIAGPRVLEHLVDTVLYFEGDKSHQFRILRAVKNRFGPAEEIGVFQMTGEGLAEVLNPSALFLAELDDEVSGTSVFAGVEGTRTVLVEIQSLIAETTQATPRRAVIGWDPSRLAMILAVLDTRCGVSVSKSEVYLNVAGGLKISEPAADLAVAAAIISSITGKPILPKTIVLGEIGLSGEIRSITHLEARLNEAEKLGFTQAIIPKIKKLKTNSYSKNNSIVIKQVKDLSDLLTIFSQLQPQKKHKARISNPEGAT